VRLECHLELSERTVQNYKTHVVPFLSVYFSDFMFVLTCMVKNHLMINKFGPAAVKIAHIYVGKNLSTDLFTAGV
jgi:hypothetical protein